MHHSCRDTGDLYGVAVNGGGVFGECAGGIDIVAEDISLQECDLTFDTAAEIHGNDVALCHSGLNGCQSAVSGLCFNRRRCRDEADDHHCGKDRRKDLSAGLGECFHVCSPSLIHLYQYDEKSHTVSWLYFTTPGGLLQ